MRARRAWSAISFADRLSTNGKLTHPMPAPSFRSHPPFTPFQVVLIVLALGVVAGGSLLLAAPETTQLMEGAIEWHEESVLRAVVRLLCLNYELPTHHPDTIKSYLLGLGAGLALLALAVDLWNRSDEEIRTSRRPDSPVMELDFRAWRDTEASVAPARFHVTPFTASQMLLALYLLWSFASSRWSSAPDLSWGASLQTAVPWLWAFVLGAALERRGVELVCRMCIGIAGVVSIVAIVYYYGRNPGLRAMFPYGNPNFLSASLLPGILLGIVGALGAGFDSRSYPRGVRVVAMGLCLATAACGVWALALTRSRGAAVGLVFGLLALATVSLRGRWRWAPLVVGIGCVVAGAWYAGRTAQTLSPTGRDATLRFRAYAWSYAWELFRDRPVTGLGQGGFVLHGDALAVNDVLEDPSVFETRIEHVHNEWLETLCDLGVVGAGLLFALLACTVAASLRSPIMRTEPAAGEFGRPARGSRDVAARLRMAGLLAALTALAVEEGFGVGLRVAGVGTWFFTVMGLLWACSRDDTRSLTKILSRTRSRRWLSGTIGTVVALVELVLVQSDWGASRNAYGAQAALEAGRLDDATRLATEATNAMNPQRALSNLHRLAEVGLAVARERQAQGLDRAQRAIAAEPLDRRLLDLALADLRAADDACRLGNHALKELISRSPGFIHQGTTEYRLNVMQARTTEIYDQMRERLPPGALREAIPQADPAEAGRFVENASRAVQRELRRQPFNPELAVAFAQTAGPPTPPREVMDVLARPLRLHSVTQEYAEVLARLMSNASFAQAFDAALEDARSVVQGSRPPEPADRSIETWAPEKLRLSAARWFLQGQLTAARDELLLATAAYDHLRRPSAIGAASAWAELADATFFLSPSEPEAARVAAGKAIAIAPRSGPGRTLVRALQSRVVDYSIVAGEGDAARESLLAMDASMTPDAVRAEVEARTRRLADSLVRRAEGGSLDWLRPKLADRVSAWIRRMNEREVDDVDAQFLAARWALIQGNAAEMETQLQRAMAAGLPPDVAVSFLDHAIEVLANDASAPRLRELRASLAARAEAGPGDAEQPVDAPEPPGVKPER